MPKPSEIFDTPEAISRVGDNKKPLRICNKTGVHTCRLGSIHLNERESLILNDYLTTKDQEKEEAVKKAYKAGKKSFLKDISKIKPIEQGKRVSYILFDEAGTVDWDKVKAALPTEDNN